ncbi:MAG: von Willebrand factor type A domain-containing protein [Acidobacteriota bacterium]
MNPKRRAELQRKLSLNAVPRPPAGLVERIKADIPQYLEIEAERRRFSGAIAFNMRVAASILFLLTSVAVTFYLVSPKTETSGTSSNAVFAPAKRELPRAAAAPTQEVRLDIAQESGLPVPPPAAPRVVPPSEIQSRVQAERSGEEADDQRAARRFAREPESPRDEQVADGVEGGVVGGVEGGVAGGMVGGVVGGRAEQAQVADSTSARNERANAPAPFVADAQPAPSVIAAPASAKARPRAAEEPMSVTAGAPSLSMVREAKAAGVSYAKKDHIFGISVDPAAFQRIRAVLENGQQPDPASVDVEGLVNYFAAAASKPPRSGVALEVEASPAAIEAAGDHAVLRFTVDAARAKDIPGGSLPPVATDARVEVKFNDRVVAKANLIGDGSSLPLESVLLSGSSVTGIYEMEMRPHLQASQTIATISLRYTSLPSGRKETVVKKILAQDLAKGWTRATRRHRLSSLGAVWGETLKGTIGAGAVARRAEELATQTNDPLARALAAAASASADGEK